MPRKTPGLTVVSALVLVAIAVAGAMAMKPAAPPAAAPSAVLSLAQEALAYRYMHQARGCGIPVPVAREKAGREASREIVAGFAQRAYEDLAYPRKAVATAQLEGALEAMRRHGRGEDRRSRRVEEVGPFTLERRLPGHAEQRPDDRAAAAPPRPWPSIPSATRTHCRLYVGAAGGGVWRTDNALSRNPHWKKFARPGLDTTSIGAPLIDLTVRVWPHDLRRHRASQAARAPAQAGLGLQGSTHRGSTGSLSGQLCGLEGPRDWRDREST